MWPLAMIPRTAEARISQAEFTRQRGDVDSVQDRTGEGGAAQTWGQGRADRHENEGGKEYPGGGGEGSGRTMEEISDERCSSKNGSGRDLPDGNRIEQLLRSEPAAPFDKFRAEKGEQHVSAAKKHRAYFYEGGENGAKPDGGCDGHATGRFRAKRDHGARRGLAGGLRAREQVSYPGESAARDQHKQGMHRHQCQRGCDRPYQRQPAAANRSAGKIPQRLQNHGNYHRFDAVEQAGGHWHCAETNIDPGQQANTECGRQNEAASGDDEARPPRAAMADVDHQLG